ncbi:MAG: cytochrome c biogenesis protein CcdA [Acidimicrobiia bacterium]|nr:cytochrome c biogenesis protein CcdA [Acidimicrobiia bacterium]
MEQCPGHAGSTPGAAAANDVLCGPGYFLQEIVEMTELFAAVFFGAVSFISPCVLPLLPGYISLISGYSIADLSEGSVDNRKVVIKTALFVLGFTLVFIGLGAGATSVGSFLRSEQSLFRVIAGWVVFALGVFVAVTAVWQPSFLMPAMKDRRVEVSPSRLGNFAPPIMGGAFAFGWTPCLGPFLGSTLALASNSDSVGQGMLQLFFYSLGLGIPFLLTSLLLARAFSFFNFLKRFLTPITVGSGVLLAMFGLLLVTNQLTVLSSWFTELLSRLGLEGLTTI